MSQVQNLITEHLDTWTLAIETKSSAGRGSSNKFTLVGIKKLRELILEMAVRGLLVPQDPHDEPASVLLEKIAADKAQLIKDKKIKKTKTLPEISDDERPFDLPNSWEWARLGNCGLGFTGKTPSTKNAEFFNGDIPFVGPGQITPNKELLDSDKFLTELGVIESVEALPNDVLMVCIGGSIGKSMKIDKRLSFNQQINSIRPIGIDASYLDFCLSSNSFQKTLLEKATGSATPIINRGKWEELLVSVAPKQEQKRIVAKVDELMALCDQLEEQTLNSIEAHQTLVETLLNELVNPNNTANIYQAWSLIAENFDVLFTTEKSIDTLKQTILQLAVMGKLVPQNPSDEPASKLLEKIAAEKAQLIKDKKIKPLPEITEEEKPFDLPTGWSFARLGDLTEKLGSGSTPRGGKAAYLDSGIPFLRSQNVWNDGIKTHDIAYISKETHEKMQNTKVFPNDVLLNITGASLGRSTIFPSKLVEANVSQHVTIIRLIEKQMNEFVHLGIISPMVQKLVWGRQVGMAIEGLSKKVLEVFEFPVPPLEEQKRIVARVNELMTLCDQLKTQLQSAQQTQIHLAQSIAQEALV